MPDGVGDLPPDPTSEFAAGFVGMVWMLHGLIEAGASVSEAAAVVAAVSLLQPRGEDNSDKT